MVNVLVLRYLVPGVSFYVGFILRKTKGKSLGSNSGTGCLSKTRFRLVGKEVLPLPVIDSIWSRKKRTYAAERRSYRSKRT